MASPKDIIARYLYGAGAFADPDVGGSWPLYRGRMPDVDGDCACIYDTAGIVQGKTLRGVTDEMYGLELIARTAVESAGYDKLRAVAATLGSVHGVIVDIDSGESWEIANVRQASTVVALGRDLQSNIVRYLHTLNLLVKLKEL